MRTCEWVFAPEGVWATLSCPNEWPSLLSCGLELRGLAWIIFMWVGVDQGRRGWRLRTQLYEETKPTPVWGVCRNHWVVRGAFNYRSPVVPREIDPKWFEARTLFLAFVDVDLEACIVQFFVLCTVLGPCSNYSIVCLPYAWQRLSKPFHETSCAKKTSKKAKPTSLVECLHGCLRCTPKWS